MITCFCYYHFLYSDRELSSDERELLGLNDNIRLVVVIKEIKQIKQEENGRIIPFSKHSYVAPHDGDVGHIESLFMFSSVVHGKLQKYHQLTCMDFYTTTIVGNNVLSRPVVVAHDGIDLSHCSSYLFIHIHFLHSILIFPVFIQWRFFHSYLTWFLPFHIVFIEEKNSSDTSWISKIMCEKSRREIHRAVILQISYSPWIFWYILRLSTLILQ